MRRRIQAAAIVLGVALLATPTFSADELDKAEHAARRARVMAQIGDGVAVFLGANLMKQDGLLQIIKRNVH